MAREHNFLLGQGERLVPKAGVLIMSLRSGAGLDGAELVTHTRPGDFSAG